MKNRLNINAGPIYGLKHITFLFFKYCRHIYANVINHAEKTLSIQTSACITSNICYEWIILLVRTAPKNKISPIQWTWIIVTIFPSHKNKNNFKFIKIFVRFHFNWTILYFNGMVLNFMCYCRNRILNSILSH